MPGIPRRAIPTTYPAPPLEADDSGLIGPRPGCPVPCSIVIFSSSVISLTTMAARSSGDRLVFIQGGGGAFSCEPACASRGIPRATTPRQSRSERKLRAREWAMRFPLGTCNWAQKNDFILLALRVRVLRGGD